MYYDRTTERQKDRRQLIRRGGKKTEREIEGMTKRHNDRKTENPRHEA